MKHKFSVLRVIINPSPYICYFAAIISILKNIIFLAHYDSFFDPIILWSVCSAILYIVASSVLIRKNKLWLFYIYILESSLRIIFSILVTHLEPKYEILFISFLAFTYLFMNDFSKHKLSFIGCGAVVIASIAFTFHNKFSSYKHFAFLTHPEQLFYATEIFSNLLITGIELIIISISASVFLKKMFVKNASTQKQLEYIKNHDILTGLMNRYRAATLFTNCESRKLNEKIEYAIAILDIDNFKKINDVYGHDCGDFVLKSYTQELRAKLPRQNKIGRWGGEEFVIIFPKITSETIFELDTIRELLSFTPFYYNGQVIHVSATYGISSSRNLPSAYDVLNDADAHLLIGKENGKNRLVVSQNF